MVNGASFSVSIDKRRLEQVIRETPRQLEQFMDKEAEGMVNDIRMSFGTSPSSPGAPPGVDTGTLRASIRWERAGQFARRIMDGVEYGVHLELGTEKMAPRPFMGPAFERERGMIDKHLKMEGLVK